MLSCLFPGVSDRNEFTSDYSLQMTVICLYAAVEKNVSAARVCVHVCVCVQLACHMRPALVTAHITHVTPLDSEYKLPDLSTTGCGINFSALHLLAPFSQVPRPRAVNSIQVYM